ncbi:MAG: thioredoxin domain-containing protein [Pedobacter sp.]|nr:MAG: thioredoxin domain-containing protein [Pedobacter sp.]
MKEANKLINASSPYLQQHAYNPVQWQEWSEEALTQAKAENKLIIVSIGYAACHWCHVMERESFENFEVAEVMNKHFVCIKVDREERPDIDQIYMLAVQLMTNQGGWPLNAICLPDQRPVYGGTYFKKYDWINILLQLADAWKTEPDKLISYASRLKAGIDQSENIVEVNPVKEWPIDSFTQALNSWKRQFDSLQGGWNRAPKFPMPNQWTFWLRYAHLMGDETAHFMVQQTLEKMAYGGIYDHLRGGFCRYSVDEYWHVPHFEKMLYDNAQLISLYSEAYQAYKNPLYKQVVEQIINWLQNEMLSPEGLFYAALDADSEGVEGKFYTWDLTEVQQVLGAEADLIARFYNLTEHGNWDEENINILQQSQSDESFAENNGIDLAVWLNIKNEALEKLLKVRNKRVRPGLDYKCLLSWNALTIKGLAEAALIFSEPKYYKLAQKAMDFIWTHMRTIDNQLYRNYAHEKAQIPAFLDDYALLIEAQLSLYAYSFDRNFLEQAEVLVKTVQAQFIASDSPMLYYTPQSNAALIARKQEIMDNVIPSSNAIMARNLWRLGTYLDKESYQAKAELMLTGILPHLIKYPSVYPNWGILFLEIEKGLKEIALVGPQYETLLNELQQYYIPNSLFLGGLNENLPLLEGKISSQTQIYLCTQKTCQLPVQRIPELLKLLKN